MVIVTKYESLNSFPLLPEDDEEQHLPELIFGIPYHSLQKWQRIPKWLHI
ncbi:hypothetical protein F966_00234 [Acinetobacter higginsii]|uniref:Uncharacterized protein n=1 Tax=Acinetobacter higginsii TaxID=70347 RepID=N8XTS6_9GAMM|nr:hypothetical protein F966_00234 [Acinetobacter higginsii]